MTNWQEPARISILLGSNVHHGNTQTDLLQAPHTRHLLLLFIIVLSEHFADLKSDYVIREKMDTLVLSTRFFLLQL